MTFTQDIARFRLNVAKLDDFLQGDADTTLQLGGQTRPSLAGLIGYTAQADEPSDPWPGRPWYDISVPSAPVFRIRNAANTAWIDIALAGDVTLIQSATGGLDTRAALVAANVPGTINTVVIAGYHAPGDGGGGLYRRVASQPAHNLRAQSADGAHWELVPVGGQVNILQAGAIPDGATDAAQALDDCSRAFRTAASTLLLGPEVILPPGDFFVSRTIQLKSTVCWRGAGGFTTEARATRLIWAAGDGVIVHDTDTLGTSTAAATTQAIASSFTGICFQGGGQNGPAADGLWMRVRAAVKECSFLLWGRHGIKIVATAGGGGAVEGNANGWSVQNTQIRECGADGMFVDGADANAGFAVGVNSSRNNGWGINDSSFLGNTYLACQAASNNRQSQVSHGGNRYHVTPADEDATSPGNPSTQAPGTGTAWTLIGAGGVSSTFPAWVSGGTYRQGGAFKSSNANARGVFLGCYSEGDQPPSYLQSPSQRFGGLHGAGIIGTGLSMDARTITGNGGLMIGPNTADTLGGMEVELRGRQDVAAELHVTGDHVRGVGLQWIDSVKAWAWLHAGSASKIAMMLTTQLSTLLGGRATAVGGGFVHFERGFFLGAGTGARMITHGFTAPPSSGEWGRGDFVFNRTPARGGVLGWVNVSTTSTPDWVAIPVPT